MLMIGFDENYGVPKLLVEPIGWDGDTIPRSSYETPPGWTFQVEPMEEESLFDVRWWKAAQGTAVMRGQSENRFSVTLAKPDSAYERGGFWGVYITGEAPRYGVIQWSELSNR